MWVYHVIIILSLLWKDIICQEAAGYSIQLKDNVHVEEGLCVTVPCTFIADNRMKLKNSKGYWRMKGSSTMEKQSFHLTRNTDIGDCTLTITDARKEDSGTYYFRIEDGEFSHIRYNYVHSPLTVTVTDLTLKPIISKSGRFILGQEVTLTCSPPVKCSGTSPVFQWTKSNENGIWKNSTLTFTPSHREHNRAITCEVTFPTVRKSTKTTIDLDVHYRPSITITVKFQGSRIQQTEPLAVLEGDSLALSCSVDSSSAVNVTWMKGEHDFHSNVTGRRAELSLTNITAIDADTYYCLGQTAYETMNESVTISVQYPPRKQDIIISSSKGTKLSTSQPFDIDEGDYLTVNCTADGNPAATVSWIKGEDKDLNKTVGQGLVWSLVTISSSEADNYTCLVRNRHGSSERRIQINLIKALQDMWTELRNMDYRLIAVIVAGNIIILFLVSLGIFYFLKKHMEKRQLDTQLSLNQPPSIWNTRRGQKQDLSASYSVKVSAVDTGGVSSDDDWAGNGFNELQEPEYIYQNVN